MSYALENALFQWEDGERRVRELGHLEDPTDVVIEELRRRLGSSFSIDELASFYGEGTDWAADVAEGAGARGETSAVVDAAFARYAREALDYAAGGRRR